MNKISNFRRKFSLLIKPAKNIVITAHYAPDDDAIGSTLSLYTILKKKYPKKKFRIIFTGGGSPRFSVFKNFDKIEFTTEISDNLRRADLLIVLDGCQYHRFSRNPEKLKNHSFAKICIDHHSSAPDKFDLKFIDTQATSTSELIYRLFEPTNLDANLSKQLMLGILGDTGFLNYLKPNQIGVMDILKKLFKKADIEIQQFVATYSTISQKVFTVIQEYCKNTVFVERKDGLSFQYSFISKEFIEKYGLNDSEASEAGHIYMGHYLRLITGYEWGFIVTPKTTEISISFRSLPRSVNVRHIAETMKIGGGHDRASGASFKFSDFDDPIGHEDAIRLLLAWIDKNELKCS